MGKTIRDDRLQVRVDAEAKQRLEDAAALAGVSLSAFVLQAAQEQADKIMTERWNELAERPVIYLSPEAWDAFVRALEEPAEVNEKLLAALRKPKKFEWLED